MQPDKWNRRRLGEAEAYALELSARSPRAIALAKARVADAEAVAERMAALTDGVAGLARFARFAGQMFCDRASVRAVRVTAEQMAHARRVCGKKGCTPARWDATARRHGLPPFQALRAHSSSPTKLVKPRDMQGYEGQADDHRRRVRAARGWLFIRWGKVCWRRRL